MKIKKSHILNICVSVVTVLLLFFLMEAIFRTFFPQNAPPNMYNANYSFGYALHPGYSSRLFSFDDFKYVRVSINQQGLREDYEIGKKTKKRILVLGDSFVFGIGLDQKETFDYYLEQYLGKDWEVINAGVPGYSTIQEILMLRNYAFLQPDIVLLGSYFNDMTDIYSTTIYNIPVPHLLYINGTITSEYVSESDYHLFVDREFSNFEHRIQPEQKQSQFFSFLQERFFRLFPRKPLLYRQPATNAHGDFIIFEKGNPNAGIYKNGYAVVLQQFLLVTKEYGVVPLIINIPPRLQVDQQYQELFFSSYTDITKDDFNFSQSDHYFSILKNSFGVDVYDLSSSYASADNPHTLYLAVDNHWSGKGTKLAAQKVAELILNEYPSQSLSS